MSQKKDGPILIIALLITVGLLGVGGWWIVQQLGNRNSSEPSPTVSTSPTPTNPPPVTSGIRSAATLTAVENIPSGLFNYGGSTTWAPIRRDIDPAITQAHPGFQLRYMNPTTGAPGSSTGIQMLLNNQLAFSQSSRSLKVEEIQAAQQRGYTLKEIPVALEGIAIAVHPDLSIAGLTVEQLQNIYTGQITNWSQVGGPNLPVTPYTRRPEEGGTVEFFLQNVLGGASFGSNVSYIPTTTE
ncbi:MAG: substrate-binding domain-containing protein, partial [Cyanobacteria bacterium J06626_14]